MILGVDAEWLMEMCYSFKVSSFDGKTVCAAAEVIRSSITAVDH
jgi:hypothetical protein